MPHKFQECAPITCFEKMASNPVVISLGGSMMFSDGEYDQEFIKNFAALALSLSKQAPIAIVVGGGSLAKKYCERERAGGKGEFFADRAAIKATVENARVLAKAIGANASVADSFDSAQAAVEKGMIPVGHGILEGITTDTVSVLLAERIGAKTVVNVSRVEAVYDSDPEKNPKAKRFDSMAHKELVALASASDARNARTNFPFDSIAAKIAARSNITIYFVDGRKLEEVEKAVLGKPHKGTAVKD